MNFRRELFKCLDQIEEPLTEVSSLLSVLFHSLSHTPDEIEYGEIQRVLLLARGSLGKVEAGYDQLSVLQAALRELAQAEQQMKQVSPVMQVASTSESII